MEPFERIIVALDFQDSEPVFKLAEVLKGKVGAFKVGLELFTAFGPDLVRRLQDMGHRIFLDLKFSDIPNTVAGAIRSASKMNIWMTTVHASSGSATLWAAVSAARECDANLKVIGVTLLTSIDEAAWLEPFSRDSRAVLKNKFSDHICNLAIMCIENGMNGIVCSPHEVSILRGLIGKDALIVTPGIRLPENEPGDQKRFALPEDAIRAGADYLVIGRPITRSSDPQMVVSEIARRLETV